MFGSFNDPQTLWLNLTNLALGVVTLLAVLVAIGGIARQMVLNHRRSREMAGLDAEMHAMLNGSPELGLTMADGGEPIEKPAGK